MTLDWNTKKNHRGGSELRSDEDITITKLSESDSKKIRYNITFRGNSWYRVAGDKPAIVVAKVNKNGSYRLYFKGEASNVGYVGSKPRTNRYATVPVDLSDFLGNHELLLDPELNLYYVEGLDWSTK